jgi:hypothetical protein
LRTYFSGVFALSTRLPEYLQSFPGKVIASTPLCDRYSSLAAPSAATLSAQVSLVVLAAYAEDPLASGLGWSNEAGADRLSLHLQVTSFVSATDLIYFPSQTSPTQALGLAWKAHLQTPWSGQVFLPARVPEEIV